MNLSNNSSAIRFCGGLLAIACLLSSGCRQEKDDASELSQAAMKLDVDANGDELAPANGISAPPPANRPPVVKESISDTTPSTPVPTAASSQPPVEIRSPAQGSLTDQGIDESVVESVNTEEIVSYRGLTYPATSQVSSSEPQQWITYLAKVDKGLQALLLDQQVNAIERSEFLNEAKRLSELKLQASEQLIDSAETNFQRELGVLGKMESLSQLSGLGDRTRAYELQEFAKTNSNFDSPEVARQAALVQLGFALNDLNNGGGDPQEIENGIDTVLADKTKLRLPDFKMLQQAIAVLSRRDMLELADRIKQKTITAFQDHPDLGIAQAVWQMKAAETPELQDVRAVLLLESPPVSQVSNAIDAFLTALPSEWSLKALVDEIPNLEYEGKFETAGVVAAAVSERLDRFQTAELLQQAKAAIDAFKQRTALIGQTLALSELTDANGKSFSLQDYRGKVVLLDFWASWCATCRAEFPELIKLHDQFQPQGFEIVGVNVDESERNMTMLTETLQLPWPNVRSSNPATPGMNSLAAQQVGLRATPLTILLDQQGKVVATNVHGQQLAKMVSQLLGQEN